MKPVIIFRFGRWKLGVMHLNNRGFFSAEKSYISICFANHYIERDIIVSFSSGEKQPPMCEFSVPAVAQFRAWPFMCVNSLFFLLCYGQRWAFSGQKA